MSHVTNIQVNVHVSAHCDCSHQPQVTHGHSGEWGAIALFAGECLVKVVVGIVLGVGAVCWQVACLGAHAVVAIERKHGSGADMIRALATGERVKELETEMITHADD